MKRFMTGISVLLLLSALTAAEFTTLDLRPAATAALADDTPGDGRGGWIDAGSDDLSCISTGVLRVCGVDFFIPGDAASGGRSAVVLGGGTLPHLPGSAVLELPEPVSGKRLYLLHAAADKGEPGTLKLTFDDDSVAVHQIVFGQDVESWRSSASRKNAVRGWSAYNGNTQVSLFVSGFSLPRPLKKVEFVGGSAPWMIVGATVGGERLLKPLLPDRTCSFEYEPEPRLDGEKIAALPVDGIPRNIIFIIGDGMGRGAQNFASLKLYGAIGQLPMEQLPVQALVSTHSANSEVTDSAASATALASGFKTNNGMVGVSPEGEVLRSVAERAHETGRAVGLITSDGITGATPGGFVAHRRQRSDFTGIAEDIAGSGYEIFAGASPEPFLPEADGGKRGDGRNLLKEMQEGGVAVADGIDQFRAAESAKVIGFFKFGAPDDRLLAEITREAIRRLAANPKGFFLMVEEFLPDKGGHSNIPDATVCGVNSVNRVLRVALDFALEHPDTLILVTGDHETGAVSAIRNFADPENPHVVYMQVSHTGEVLPLFAVGAGAERFNGVIDNTRIPRIITEMWKLPEK